MQADDHEARLRRIEDIEEIRLLKHQYCAYCDDNYNPEGLASLWIEDGTWDAGEDFGVYAGREAIAGFFRNVGPTIDFAAHLVMNEMINVKGDTATGKWWCLMPSTFIEDGEKVDRWLIGEYTEEYVKVDGKWFYKSLHSKIHKNAPHLTGWGNP
jgi:hypothetical protein